MRSEWGEQQWQDHLTALLAQAERTKEARAAAYRQFMCDVMAAAKLPNLEVNGHRIADFRTEDGEVISQEYTEEQRQAEIDLMQQSGEYGDEMGLRLMAAALGNNIKITASDAYLDRLTPDIEYRYGDDDGPVMQFHHTMLQHEDGTKSPHWQVKQGNEIIEVLADGNCLFHAMDLNNVLAANSAVSEYQDIPDAYSRHREQQAQQGKPALQAWRGGNLRNDNPQSMEIQLRAQSLYDVFQDKLDHGMDINGILNIAESLAETDATFAEEFQRLNITRDEDQNLEELHQKAEQLIDSMIERCSVSEEQTNELLEKLASSRCLAPKS